MSSQDANPVSSREHEQRQNVVAENETPTLGGKHRRSTGEPAHEPCREDRGTRGETMKPITEVMQSWRSSIRSQNFFPESKTRRAMHQSDRPHNDPERSTRSRKIRMPACALPVCAEKSPLILHDGRHADPRRGAELR